MTALYQHTTRVTGTILTDLIYNSAHQNHINSRIPGLLDDYSVNAAQMQVQTDPGEVGTESQATSAAGELERIRFTLKEYKSSTYWYESRTFLGSWMPELRTSAFNTDVDTVYVSRSGHYYKRGLVVKINFSIKLSKKHVPVGYEGTGIHIYNLPFSVLDYASGFLRYANLSNTILPLSRLVAVAESGTNYILIRYDDITVTNPTIFTNDNLMDTTELYGSLSYIASS